MQSYRTRPILQPQINMIKDIYMSPFPILSFSPIERLNIIGFEVQDYMKNCRGKRLMILWTIFQNIVKFYKNVKNWNMRAFRCQYFCMPGRQA